MKSFIALSLAALVAAGTVGRRQTRLTVTQKTLEPEIKKNAVHVYQKFGPISLKGRGTGQDSGQQNFFFSIPSNGFCRNCTVLRGHIGLENMDGTPGLPKNGSGVYIHHILTTDTSKRAAAFTQCNSGGSSFALPGAKFVGSGEDNNNVAVWYTNKDGSSNGGFHIGASDSFSMMADIVSLNAATSQIYITMDMEYLPGIVGSDSRETLLSVELCGGSRLTTSNTAPTKSKSGVYKFTESGQIIVAKGHLHAGGDKVSIYINDKLVCDSKAVYSDLKGSGAISEMTVCPVLPVKQGDTMYFVAVYDGSKHPLRHESHGLSGGMPDVMGMLDIVFSK